jgi:phenylacetate-coenzyme A ligase PaaK-like adenylate-forming protein
MERNHILEERIFSLGKNEYNFERIALEVFRFQKKHCAIYSDFISMLGITEANSIHEIPFLPISFFKTHRVSCSSKEELLFKSSGTTGKDRSEHSLLSKEIYERSFLSFYKLAIGNPKEHVILALLPNYVEQGNSSLVYMVDKLIRETESSLSGFVLDCSNELKMRYDKSVAQGKKTVILGVSYALLDLAEQCMDLSKAIIVETGGMKGRRKEMTKEELHLKIKKGTGVDFVSSEYGMTELLSQGYSLHDGLFRFPNWMKVLIRDVNDPMSYSEKGKTGGINMIDLANLYSCSFIATQDLGKIESEGLRLMGRFDLADIRGCNLMVQ